MPFRSFAMIASSDDSTIAARKAWAAAALPQPVISRAIFEAPMIVPEASRTGDTVNAIRSRRPVLCQAHGFEMIHPLAAPEAFEIVILLRLQLRWNQPFALDCPPDSVAAVPEHPLGGGLHDWMMPSRFLEMIASSAD